MACAKLDVAMSRRNKHSKPRQRSLSTPPVAGAGIPMPSIGGTWDIGEAIKTYLQENVALIRPQVADTEMAHLFRFGCTVWSAAVYRAQALRQVDYILADVDNQPLSKDKKLANDPLVLSINRALKKNFKSILERSEISYCFYGEILWKKNLSPVTGHLANFQWINNNFWQLDTDMWDGLKGFRIRSMYGSDIDPDLTYIPEDQAVYMHNMDFFEDFGGVGPAQVCYVQAATETEIAATQLQFFRNMAMPAFAMQPADGDGFRPGPDQKQEITELLRRMYQGSANAGRTVVLPTRWEMLKFQQEFDKLGMPQLTTTAVDSVIRVMRVPLELLDPRQATRAVGTKFYDQKREWLISWMVPQAELYADELTEQIAHPISSDWQIIPTFKRVRGLEEDVSSRTDTVTKQVADTLMDLYTAQETLGIVPDKRLKGIYMVAKVPVPIDKIDTYYLNAPGTPGFGQAEANSGTNSSNGTSATTSTDASDRTTSSYEDHAEKSADGGQKAAIPFLADAKYTEWKNWQLVVQRRGANYAFTSKSLSSSTVAYGKLLLATKGANDSTWNTIRIWAVKDYDDTENIYRTALYNAMTDAFNGSLDRVKFGVTGRDEISTAFLNAFSNGLQEGGVDPAEMSDEERSALQDEVKMERLYWTKLAGEMFSEVIPLKDTDGFQPACDKMLGRIEGWVNKGLRRVYDMGKAYANLNSMKRWDYGGTIDHCESCKVAQGQVHRVRTWMKYLVPRSSSCICTGIKCDCDLVDTDERARGSLSSIPLAGFKSHDHDDHVETETELVEAIV